MSKEDELAQALIELYDIDDYWVEVPYNHYGDRGVVDLVTYDSELGEYNCIEIKSTSAVKNATGANEVLRQFNRHVEYFENNNSIGVQLLDDVSYQLVFFATEHNAKHIQDNIALYETVEPLYLRHPNTTTPAIVTGGEIHLQGDDVLNSVIGGVVNDE